MTKFIIANAFILVIGICTTFAISIKKNNFYLKADTINGNSKIIGVTLFLQGAQITRTVKIHVKKTSNCIALTGQTHYKRSSTLVK